ncbi:hypothetical protein IGI04_042571 [Brassica rapa subsp. trilocularis]|uniref:Uncharacterized protein n=1 Tax=Brassica rapa subsp. trilocularis TaxID=1813537 RepID=A0ABQ7KJ04_BRACM|nr:hypothetical protein IGI04_042571 [Brassica rapa subsp. trilocularis]
MASPLGGLRNQPGSLIDPNTLVSYPCWSLSGVSGSQEVSSAHHLSKKRGRLEPLCGAMGRYLCVEAGLRSAGHEVVELLVQDIQAEDQPLCGAMGRFLCVEAGLRSAGHEVVELLVQGTQEEEGHHLCHEEGRLLPTFCGKSTACSKEGREDVPTHQMSVERTVDMQRKSITRRVHKGSDTCNSPSTKNVETKSLVYRKCSMGHYAMRGVSCETLYGDSNTLVPVTSRCKGFYKDHQPDQVSGVSRQEAVQSSLGKYHCLSLTKDVPGQFLASLRWLRSLLRGGDPNQFYEEGKPFSKKAVKSVERGRPQTSSMKRKDLD